MLAGMFITAKAIESCENGLKEAFAGLDIRNANNAPAHILHLERRQRPTIREHARPHPPAGSRRYGGGAEVPAPVPVGVTGHRTQRPRGQVGPPGPHPAQPSSSLNPGGERRPIPPPLAPPGSRSWSQPAGSVVLAYLRTSSYACSPLQQL
jgi:hypothetical protein